MKATGSRVKISMPSYSPISKIHIKNFRNIGEAVLDFDESPIISLIGENEAGKTSVVKAFSVCAIHSSPRDQKDYIRDGTNGFGVAIELKDGTLVTRIKTPTMNRYTVKHPDGRVWDATKLDGLPVEVQEVMGLIEEPETKEYLQIRTYEDQLLFVVTPASTNYKVMYNALKVGQLTNAIKTGSKEANTLKQEVNNNETGIETLTSSLRGIKTYDIEPLLKIKTRLANELAVLEKIEAANNLAESIQSKKNQLGAYAELDRASIGQINELEASNLIATARTLERIRQGMNAVSAYKEIESTPEIDLTTLNKLLSISQRKDALDNQVKEAGAISSINKAEEVDIQTLELLIRASGIADGINALRIRLGIIDVSNAELVDQLDFNAVIKSEHILQIKSAMETNISTLEKVDIYCKQMSDYIKSLGAAVEICPNCGESVVIDIDKYATV